MPRPKHIGLFIAAFAAITQFLGLLLYLWHERDHDSTDYTMDVLIVSVFILSTIVTAWAVRKNLKDANRAESLEAQIITIKDEHQLQMKGQKKQYEQKAEGARKANDALIGQLAEQTRLANEHFRSFSRESLEHDATRAQQRDANTYRVRAEKQLEECNKLLADERDKVSQRDVAYCAEVDRHNATKRNLGDALARWPEVWLGLSDSAILTIENRSKDCDAVSVSLDPFETTNYRAELQEVALLRFDDTAQPVYGEMFHKPKNIRFVDVDLAEMLKDSSDTFECRLEFTLRYSDHRGNHFVRCAVLETSRLLVSAGKLPQIINRAIERDRDESEAL